MPVNTTCLQLSSVEYHLNFRPYVTPITDIRNKLLHLIWTKKCLIGHTFQNTKQLTGWNIFQLDIFSPINGRTSTCPTQNKAQTAVSHNFRSNFMRCVSITFQCSGLIVVVCHHTKHSHTTLPINIACLGKETRKRDFQV